MDQKERERRISFAQNQIEISKMRAMISHAKIISGAYRFRNVSQGCEPSEFNPTGWRQLTNDEKLQSEIECMDRHIQFMCDCNDTIYELMKET